MAEDNKELRAKSSLSALREEEMVEGLASTSLRKALGRCLTEVSRVRKGYRPEVCPVPSPQEVVVYQAPGTARVLRTPKRPQE